MYEDSSTDSSTDQQTARDSWPPGIPPRGDPDEIISTSEAGLASLLLYKSGDDYRFATDLRCWIVRDRDRWARAPQGVTDLITGAADMTPYDERADSPGNRKWARERQGGVIGMKRDADGARRPLTHEDVLRNELAGKMRTPAAQARVAALMRSMATRETADPVRADELDAEPATLWAGSVPFDLARSVSEPVWAEDHGQRLPMTCPHMLTCNYCPDIRVRTPVWDELTAAIFPDVNEREHALNALAHGLHGWPSEAAILARSATGTAKSLIASLISDLLGDYAGQVAASTLFGRNGNSQFAFDEMAGARFVVMNEGKKASFASTEAFKAVVGPDPKVNARSRHERHRRLVPARHTLMLLVNPSADLDYADPAVVRRLIPAGFGGDPAKIAAIAARYGTKNAEGLAAWRAEAPGVLAQMIVRCAYVLGDPANRGTRADVPESARSRFEAVTLEADPFGRWFTVRTAEGSPTATDDLLADYERWCSARHEVALSPTWFGRAMASRGVERASVGHGRGWRIALRP